MPDRGRQFLGGARRMAGVVDQGRGERPQIPGQSRLEPRYQFGIGAVYFVGMPPAMVGQDDRAEFAGAGFNDPKTR